MATVRLIGLVGHKSSGKSSVARILHENHGYTRTRFAGPLKQMLKCLGLSERHIEGDLKEVPCDILGGKTPRWAMQTLGTEWGRELITDQLWINAWKAKIELYMPAVAEDCRFANEASAVRSMGGEIWFVDRPGCKGDAHASETELETIKPDLTIRNHTSLMGLESEIKTMFLRRAA